MALGATGITTSLVGNALGTTSRNVGGLCSSSLVNPWSKWKPISSTATTMTLAILKSANYGITIKSATTLTNLLSLVQANNNLGFVYNKPIGGANSPYRLGDFRNYEHSSAIPVLSMYEDGDVIPILGVDASYATGIDGMESADEVDDSQKNLVKNNIYPSGLTRGVLITDGTNSSWSVGNVPWGNTYWQRFKGKTVTALEFLTNLASGTTFVGHTASANDRFYALPYPLHSITAANTAPSGSKDVFVDYTSKPLNKIAFSDSTYSSVTYNFQFSSIGDVYRGGTLTNVYIGLYSDANCNNVITQKKIADSITIGTEEVGSNYFGSLANTNKSPMVYVGFYWNYKLQWKTMPEQQIMPQE